MKLFKCARGVNTDYYVHISCAGMGAELIADMPEENSTQVGSEWENMLPSSLGDFAGGVGQAIANGVRAVTGTSAKAQFATTQTWVNSSPVEIPLSLSFVAVDDAYEDVVAPIRFLEKLTMPTAAGGILYAPGPAPSATNFVSSMFGYDQSNEVSVVIGKLVRLTSAIVISASSTFSSRLSNAGYPIQGRCDLQIRSSQVLSRDEWAIITGT